MNNGAMMAGGGGSTGHSMLIIAITSSRAALAILQYIAYQPPISNIKYQDVVCLEAIEYDNQLQLIGRLATKPVGRYRSMRGDNCWWASAELNRRDG